MSPNAEFIIEMVVNVSEKAGFRIIYGEPPTIYYTKIDRFIIERRYEEYIHVKTYDDGWWNHEFWIEITQELDNPTYDPRCDVMRVFRKIMKKGEKHAPLCLKKVYEVLYGV